MKQLKILHVVRHAKSYWDYESIADIDRTLKEKGIRVAMVTSGILIPKHALAIAQCIDEVYISLDGATPESYKSIRGVDGLGLIRQGMEKLAGRLPIRLYWLAGTSE